MTSGISYSKWVSVLIENQEIPTWLVELDLSTFTTIFTKLELFALQICTNKNIQYVFYDYNLRFDAWTQKETPSFDSLDKPQVFLLIKVEINNY